MSGGIEWGRTLWFVFGAIGAVVFYGRFYVQWWASERKKRIVIPIAFWYMSAVGGIMQFAYAVHRLSPGAALGLCFNIFVYIRNLVHIWRERGTLTRRLSIAVHGIAVVAVIVSVCLMAMTWVYEWKKNAALHPDAATANWIWLGVWGGGQALFFLRSLTQWLISESQKKSIVPPIFWYLSITAATLQAASFIQRHDWVFAAGMAATIVIYARNLWFMHTEPAENQPNESVPAACARKEKAA